MSAPPGPRAPPPSASTPTPARARTNSSSINSATLFILSLAARASQQPETVSPLALPPPDNRTPPRHSLPLTISPERLRKPNGKARPIAIGDALEALAGRCMLHAKRPALREYFSSSADVDACLASGDWRAAFAHVPADPSPPSCPDVAPARPPPALQLAFAPAGTDLAHFALQALYESGGAIFGHDGVNTFNTISREAAADALRLCPITSDLLPAYRLKYGRLRSLRYHRQPFTADGAVVHSCLGPQQGCTWGTLVCALVHQRALTLATLRHPGSTVLGFADDAHVHNLNPRHAFSSLLLLRQVLKERVGVEHNDKGGCIAAPGFDITFAPASFPGSPRHAAGPHRAYPRVATLSRHACASSVTVHATR
ncbi:hypothetical protein AB1Y20_018127 [Prymnesium parvum]|uniref:Reverse transcriptase domain-containing protein n=1 Tax=Prymnesium parvum TaxID=97485 RepID=A0AB34JQM6_PRYPA